MPHKPSLWPFRHSHNYHHLRFLASKHCWPRNRIRRGLVRIISDPRIRTFIRTRKRNLRTGSSARARAVHADLDARWIELRAGIAVRSM